MKMYKFLIKTPEMLPNVGQYNGYVAIPNEHPYFKKSYWDIKDIEIHGGITLSEELEDFVSERIEWIGEQPENLENYWVFGFDTCHYGDNSTNWNKENVIKEVEQLERQLLEVS